jgi:hypothetical protein
MEKSYSLVPVSTSRQLVTTDYLAEEVQEAATAEKEEALSEYQELVADIERLEFEKEMTAIRAENTRKYYENEFAELMDIVEQLLIEVEEKYADIDDEYDFEDEDEGDFEDDDDDTDRNKKYKRGSADMDIEDYLREAIESPNDRDRRSDIDEDDDGFNNADQTAANLKRKCRKIYLAIVSKTHPDRCGNNSKVHLFQLAVIAMEVFNLKALESIYEQVFGRPYGKTNLMERLIALRLRKSLLQKEINEIRQSNSWALHLIEIEEGRAFARQQYESALRNKISELRAILRGDFTQCES